jgi:ribosomal protein S18 acetylase RimI-like enzyme
MPSPTSLMHALESLILKGKGLPPEGLEVLKNAKQRDAMKMIKEDEYGSVRALIDDDNTNYIWKGSDALHDDVNALLKTPYDSDFPLGHGDVYEMHNGKLHSRSVPMDETIPVDDWENWHNEQLRRFFPFGSAAFGLGSLPTQEEPQKFMSGGLVKKGLKEALEHLNSYKGQGHHAINTEKGRPIQDTMMKELGEDADYPMNLLRFNYGAFDDAGNSLRPEELKVGDILSAKNLTSTYGDYDDDMLEEIAANWRLNDTEPHTFQIRTEPSLRHINVEESLKKLHGDKFSDHENEIIAAPGLRYMLEDLPELRTTPDGSTYYNYWLKHLPESERAEFPELFSKKIKGYIASGALAAPALSMQEQEPQQFASGGLIKNAGKALSKELDNLLLRPAETKKMNMLGVDYENKPIEALIVDPVTGQEKKIGNVSLYHSKDGVELSTIDVDNEYRRKGVGTALAKAAREATKGDKLFTTIHTRDGNKLFKSLGMSEPGDLPEEFASGGLVKQGAKQLRELLENLHKTDPERMKLADEAGYDTSKIFLRGRTDTADHLDPSLAEDGRIHVTDDPELAYRYALSSEMNKKFDIKDDPYSVFLNEEISPNIIPVFAKKGHNIDAKGKQWFEVQDNRLFGDSNRKGVTVLNNVNDEPGYDMAVNYSYPDLYKLMEQSVKKSPKNIATAFSSNPRDFKSIFNDFTEDSLKSKKFKHGGYVCKKVSS